MNNLIGIAGVFVLTFSLIALYHLMSAFGHHSARHGAQIRPLENSNEQRHTSHEQRRTPDKDDFWLRGELETPSGQPDAGRGEGIRRFPLR